MQCLKLTEKEVFQRRLESLHGDDASTQFLPIRFTMLPCPQRPVTLAPIHYFAGGSNRTLFLKADEMPRSNTGLDPVGGRSGMLEAGRNRWMLTMLLLSSSS